MPYKSRFSLFGADEDKRISGSSPFNWKVVSTYISSIEEVLSSLQLDCKKMNRNIK